MRIPIVLTFVALALAGPSGVRGIKRLPALLFSKGVLVKTLQKQAF
jgi:hypothetical protein